MRTIAEAASEIKAADPNTSITNYAIRRMVLDGTIPHIKSGSKRLVCLDLLLEYFSATQDQCSTSSMYGKIRPISERSE